MVQQNILKFGKLGHFLTCTVPIYDFESTLSTIDCNMINNNQ